MNFITDVDDYATVDGGIVVRECPCIIAVGVYQRVDSDNGYSKRAHHLEILQIRVRDLKNDAVGCC